MTAAAMMLSVSACSSDSPPPAETPAGDSTEAPDTGDAEAYKPPANIEVIVPFAPGGGASNSQQVFNDGANRLTGVNLAMINVPGAGGATGWAQLAGTEPDGKTLAIVTPPNSVLPPILYPDETGYTADDFSYICTYAVVPDTLYVRRDSGIATIDDLIAYSDANPGKVTVAVTGAVGADSLTALLIGEATGIDFTFVPFEGGAESLQALLSGTTLTMSASVGYIESQSDDLIPLGITSEERSKDFPDVPTFTEQGYDAVNERFRTLAGPPGLPQEIVDYWADVCEQLVDDADFQEKLLAQGQPPQYLDPQQTADAIAKMNEAAAKVADKMLALAG